MCPFRNLVFEGGGVKGIAYVGAMQELGKRGILDGIERVGGASAGAIYATIVGLNFSGDDICRRGRPQGQKGVQVNVFYGDQPVHPVFRDFFVRAHAENVRRRCGTDFHVVPVKL